jgi:hypothetical protein
VSKWFSSTSLLRPKSVILISLNTGVHVLYTGVHVLNTGVHVLNTGIYVLNTGVYVLNTGVHVLNTNTGVHVSHTSFHTFAWLAVKNYATEAGEVKVLDVPFVKQNISRLQIIMNNSLSLLTQVLETAKEVEGY